MTKGLREEGLVKASKWQWMEWKDKLWSDFKNRDWISNPLQQRMNSHEWAPRESDTFTQRAKATHRSQRKSVDFCVHSTLRPRAYASRCNCPSIRLLRNRESSWEKGTNSCSDWRSPSALCYFHGVSWVEWNSKASWVIKGKDEPLLELILISSLSFLPVVLEVDLDVFHSISYLFMTLFDGYLSIHFTFNHMKAGSVSGRFLDPTMGSGLW